MAAGLALVVIRVVIAHAFRRNELRMEHVSAICGPVINAKYICVFDSAMHHQQRLTTKQLVFQCRGEDYRLRFLLTMLDAFKALNNLSIREDSSCNNPIIRVTDSVREIQGLSPFLKTPTTMLPCTFLAGVFPVFRSSVGTKKDLPRGKRQIALHESERHPSSLVLPEISYRGAVGPSHFVPLERCKSGAGRNDDDSSPSCRKISLLISLLPCAVLPLLDFYALWSVQDGPHFRRRALSLLRSLADFAYFGGLLLNVLIQKRKFLRYVQQTVAEFFDGCDELLKRRLHMPERGRPNPQTLTRTKYTS